MIKKTEIKNVFVWNTFDVNTPQFLKEAAENCNGGMYAICWNIFRNLLLQVAKRATEINDPVLDVLMLKLNLYDVDLSKRRDLIKELEQYYYKNLEEN